MLVAQEKWCATCAEEKPLKEFYVDPSRRDGRASRCKDCRSAYNKARYQAKREEIKAATASYAAANRDRSRAHKRDWNRRNPGLVKEAVLRFRAGGAAGSDYTTIALIQERVDLYGGRCYYCGVEDAGHLDHRIPLSRGGSHWPANIVPCCLTCNSRKHTMSEPAFRFRLTVEGVISPRHAHPESV